jgi:hypothetical protein
MDEHKVNQLFEEFHEAERLAKEAKRRYLAAKAELETNSLKAFLSSKKLFVKLRGKLREVEFISSVEGDSLKWNVLNRETGSKYQVWSWDVLDENGNRVSSLK